MRGSPRESSTLMNMVDGIFAVAITLIPATLPNTVPPGKGYVLIQNTGAIVLIAFTMLLMAELGLEYTTLLDVPNEGEGSSLEVAPRRRPVLVQG